MLSTGPRLRLLRLLSCVTLVLLFQVTDAKRDLKSACTTCQQITDNFNKVKGTFPDLSFVLFTIFLLISCSNIASVPGTLNGAKCLQLLSDTSLFLSVQTVALFLCFRALTEQQSRTSGEATQPGRRENCPNMRPGERTHPVPSKTTGHPATAELCLPCATHSCWLVHLAQEAYQSFR